MIQELIQAMLYIIPVWLGAIIVTLLLNRIMPFKHRPVSFQSARREAILGLCLLAVTIVLLVLLIIVLSPLLAFYAEYDLPTRSLVNMAVQLLVMGIFIAPFAVALLIRRQTLSTTGLSWNNIGSSVLLGIILGSITIISYAVVYGKAFTLFSGLSSTHLYFFVATLSVGFREEVVFRGYLHLRLIAWLGPRRGWILTAIIFTISHFGQSISGLIGVFVTGLVFGWVMRKSENIVGLSVWHAFMDWVWIL